MLGSDVNSNKTASELFAMALPQEVKLDYYALEEPWTLQHNPYSARPEGDVVAIVNDIIKFISHE